MRLWTASVEMTMFWVGEGEQLLLGWVMVCIPPFAKCAKDGAPGDGGREAGFSTARSTMRLWTASVEMTMFGWGRESNCNGFLAG